MHNGVRKWKKLYASFVLVGALSATSSFAATRIEDDFNDGGLGPFKTVQLDPTGVRVVAGEVECKGSFANAFYYDDINFKDFVLEYEMRIASNSGTSETYFRANKETIAQGIAVGYMFSFRNDLQTIQLWKFDNGSQLLLSTKAFPFKLNTMYRVRIAATGNLISIFVNDDLQIQVVDNSFVAGGVRLGSWQDPAAGFNAEDIFYDNIKINSWTKQ